MRPRTHLAVFWSLNLWCLVKLSCGISIDEHDVLFLNNWVLMRAFLVGVRVRACVYLCLRECCAFVCCCAFNFLYLRALMLISLCMCLQARNCVYLCVYLQVCSQVCVRVQLSAHTYHCLSVWQSVGLRIYYCARELRSSR